ncbi:MAG: phosphate acyltransferase, partial [Candidatus Kapaibacterium sp.]
MSARTFLHRLHERARERAARVAFPDALDVRTLQAASTLASMGIATPVLVGDPGVVTRLAADEGCPRDGMVIVDPAACAQRQDLVDAFMTVRKGKVASVDEARARCASPLIAAGMLLHLDEVDAVVAGSTSSTADVLRAALATIPLAPGVATLSSYFLMVLGDRVLAYADCAVVPEPDAAQLCDIAYSTCVNMRRVAEQEPRVAFLSFSTRGSAESASVLRVREATASFVRRHPDIPADGELQADAALVPEIAARKAPGSTLQGDANVLVFPSLDAGNIGYKLTERLAGAVALGPLVQGMS